MGGFMGGDPILTPERLAELVAAGQVRFVMVEDAARLRRRFGFDPGRQAVADWVRGNGRAVDPHLWRQPGEPPAGDAATPRRARAGGPGGRALSDLNPRPALAPGRAGGPDPSSPPPTTASGRSARPWTASSRASEPIRSRSCS